MDTENVSPKIAVFTKMNIIQSIIAESHDSLQLGQSGWTRNKQSINSMYVQTE